MRGLALLLLALFLSGCACRSTWFRSCGPAGEDPYPPCPARHALCAPAPGQVVCGVTPDGKRVTCCRCPEE